MREAVFLALEEVMIQTYGAEKPVRPPSDQASD